MSITAWGLVLLLLLCAAGSAVFFLARRRRKLAKEPPEKLPKKLPKKPVSDTKPSSESPFKISYAPSDMEWSGSTSGAIPLKTLTYKQYECLEDARYGFKIVGVTPSERKKEQPHKTRAHGQKTVASLVRHGFLAANTADGFVITDLGLNALEVCDVRY